MLHVEQIRLLYFLKFYTVADEQACFHMLGAHNHQADKKALSYMLRPLVKYKYISQRDDNLYGLLSKGKEVAQEYPCLVSCGGNKDTRTRAAAISGMAALFRWHGICTASALSADTYPVFIPSPAWRKIRRGLISTTRFLGVVCWNKHILPIYYIGNGEMEWQTYAERSLFFKDYGSYETRATGMLLVCDDGMSFSVGKSIIQRTLWDRKNLLKTSHFESDKKRCYSKSPIRMHSGYEHVYLAERQDIMEILRTIVNSKLLRKKFAESLGANPDSFYGESLDVGQQRYYFCLGNDLLLLAKEFADQKTMLGRWSESHVYTHFFVHEKYAVLAKIYEYDRLIIHEISEEEIKRIRS